MSENHCCNAINNHLSSASIRSIEEYVCNDDDDDDDGDDYIGEGGDGHHYY
jgi:hypothetical protein